MLCTLLFVVDERRSDSDDFIGFPGIKDRRDPGAGTGRFYESNGLFFPFIALD